MTLSKPATRFKILRYSMPNILLQILGSLAPLIHSDTGTMDRWLWVRRRLPITRNGEQLLDVGCGTGAFSINADKRGYTCLGLTWDEPATAVATERAWICKADKTSFRVVDVRQLDQQTDLIGGFDVEEIADNIGWLSQKTIFVFKKMKFILPLAWLVILPLRPIVHLFDRPLTRFFGRKFFSICLVAYRPRFR